MKKNEIIFNDKEVFSSNEILPLKKGDQFYFSVREFFTREQSIFLEENRNLPEAFLNDYLESIRTECKEQKSD